MSELLLAEGDITRFEADVIVNAANSRLAGGGGVDGAIHAAGGPAIMAELDRIRAEIGSCPTGQAVITGAGNLAAKWVVHAVGPVYRGGANGERDLLASCYATALRLASQKGARTIALPAISAGIYGYPLDEAAEVAITTVSAGLRDEDVTVERATFVLFGREAYEAFERALSAHRRNG